MSRCPLDDFADNEKVNRDDKARRETEGDKVGLSATAAVCVCILKSLLHQSQCP